MLLIALAMLPGWPMVLESLEHLVHDGHMPHSEQHDVADASEHHADGEDEHACTPTAHHCGCHYSVSVILGDAVPIKPSPHARFVAPRDAEHPPTRALAPPTRPPIS